jgi:acetyltransferase-like isoleucine patch superfamily enzyme
MDRSRQGRIVPAVHGRRQLEPDPSAEIELADRLRRERSRPALFELADKYTYGSTDEDARMRRAIWRAVTRSFGHGVRIGRGAIKSPPETFENGDCVFNREQAFIQGRFDGRCVIGAFSWIGPQSYFDARDLAIGEHVGWGPGAKVLGSTHTGTPMDVPVIQTDLRIEPVRIEAGADIGVNAVVLPGVTIGKGAIVGAGAVVTRDVEPFSVVAGVPARMIRRRSEAESQHT